MSTITKQQSEVVKRCQTSVSWFLRNFGKVKHPSAGVIPFDPFKYQRNAIKAFRENRYNIFRKCRQCFRGDQMVWTPSGPRRIDSIKVNDQVYSMNPHTRRLEVVLVEGVHDNGYAELIEIRAKGGHRSVCTKDHIFFTESGEVEAGNLTKEHVLVHPTFVFSESPEISDEEIDEAVDQSIYNEVLPDKVFGWSKSSIERLIMRMYLGHSWTANQGKCIVQCRAVNEYLCQQVKQLFAMIGVYSTLRKGNSISHPYLEASNESASVLINMGMRSPRNIKPNQKVSRLKHGTVSAVKELDADAKVYDLSVSPYNNYIVDGVVVHNCGISKISGAYALWFAMFHSHKTILIVSRTDEDAMGFLRENVVFPFKNLPEWMQELWKPIKDNDHEIVFPNGSRIKSLTSNPDVLRSNASSLNIIDEAAFIPGMDVMWAGGWSCARPDTLIQTDSGLVKIVDFGNPDGEQWQDVDFSVSTDEGYQKSTAFYVSGKCPTKIIDTALGFQFEGTHKHRLRTIDEAGEYVWKRLPEIRPGDTLVSLPGTFRGKTQLLSDGTPVTPELAEFIGLYVGDGSVSRERLDSAEFIDLLNASGLLSKTCPQDAQIPDKILRSPRKVLCAFLRGLFSSDGWCYNTTAHMKLGMGSSSEKLTEQVQVALHALGIISKRYMEESCHERYSDKPFWRVEILDAANKVKFREIGFCCARKQAVLDDFCGEQAFSEIDHQVLVYEWASAAIMAMLAGGTFRACQDCRKWNLYRIKREGRVRVDTALEISHEFGLSDRLSGYLKQGLYFDSAALIRDGESETYDISVPHNNTYLANGMVSHNTLQHGGSVIVISTTNGIGNWYWSTWTDAEEGHSHFNAIKVNWWDMDWSIEYVDPASREHTRIAPTDGLVKCDNTITRHPKYGEVRLDPEKYGPYWSPWLEEQYIGLQKKGETWKFEQEVLASFIGSGNTVLSKAALNYVGSTIRPPKRIITGLQNYVHPVNGDMGTVDFTQKEDNDGFWVWKEPVIGTPGKYAGKQLVEPGTPPHTYVMGVDIATGKSRDYHAIEIFDIMEMEQVAEYMGKCLPREFKKIVDRVGRWYNGALAVIERNNGGDAFIDEMRLEMMYPRLWRKKDIDDKPKRSTSNTSSVRYADYGFFTTTSSKPVLNQGMLNFIREKEGEGYKIYSSRLHKQLQTYVRKKDKTGRDTGQTEASAGNYDDLVMACAMAIVGAPDAITGNITSLLPQSAMTFMDLPPLNQIDADSQARRWASEGGPGLLIPSVSIPDMPPEADAMAQIERFAMQLGAIPLIPGNIPITTNRKHIINQRSK